MPGADEDRAARAAVADGDLAAEHRGERPVAAVGRSASACRARWRRCRGRGCGTARRGRCPTGGGRRGASRAAAGRRAPARRRSARGAGTQAAKLPPRRTSSVMPAALRAWRTWKTRAAEACRSGCGRAPSRALRSATVPRRASTMEPDGDLAARGAEHTVAVRSRAGGPLRCRCSGRPRRSGRGRAGRRARCRAGPGRPPGRAPAPAGASGRAPMAARPSPGATRASRGRCGPGPAPCTRGCRPGRWSTSTVLPPAGSGSDGERSGAVHAAECRRGP